MSGFPVLADVTLAAPSLTLDLPALDLSGWHLVRLVSILQCASGQYQRSMLRFNDDAARNYIWQVKNNDLSDVNSSDTVTYTAGLEAAHGNGPDQGTSYWGTNHVDLINPGSSSLYKPYILRGGNMPENTATEALATIGSGYWQNTAPITKITNFANEGVNWVAGSRAVLLGVIPVHTPSSVGPDSALQTASDNFDRADNTSLGAGWTPNTAVFGGQHQIVGNAVKHDPTGATSSNFYTGITTHGNQFSQIQYTNLLSENGWAGVTVRDGAAGNGYLLIAFNNAGTYNIWNLYRMDAGAYTQIGSWTSLFVAGDTMRLEAVGSTLTAYHNGVALGSATDATYATGHPGIQTHVASGTDAAHADNWQGGEL